MLRPRNDLVLIRRIKDEEDSVIITPEAFEVPSNKGEVIAVGRGELIDGKLIPIDLSPGDEVIFSKYSENEVVVDGQSFMLVRNAEVYGVEDGKPYPRPRKAKVPAGVSA